MSKLAWFESGLGKLLPGQERRRQYENRPKRRRWPGRLRTWVGLAATLWGMTLPASAGQMDAPTWVAVVAHRGDHTAAHENSLEAVGHAIRAGADYVELDVRATRDGELVLLHDATVDRTTDGQGRIADLTWAEVQRLELVDRQRANLPASRVPRLVDALGVLQGRVGLYLDFKSGDREKTMGLLRRYQMVDSTIVYDQREALRTWKKLEPALATMTSPRPEDLSSDTLPTLKQRLQADILDGPATLYTPASVLEARHHGLPVWPDIQGPWENALFWDRVLALHADGYQTDRPADFVRYLRGRDLRQTLERDQGAIVRGRPDRRRLALVFTGHEYAEGGEVILDELAARGIAGGFFLTGTFLETGAYAPLVKRMVQEGHYVGPHSDRHLLYCGWGGARPTLISKDDFHQDLRANLDRLTRSGVPREGVTHFLPPYEHHNQAIAAWTREAGLTLINHTPGTRSAADYTGESDSSFVSSAAILEGILAREEQRGLNGWILLFHLGAGPGRADKLHPHVGGLIDELIRRGYAFERVDRMLAEDPPRRPLFLRFSQLGYRPDDVKRAVAFSAGLLPTVFEVVEADSGRVVSGGSIQAAAGGGWGRFDAHGELDFTELTRPGSYRLRVDRGTSEPFRIDEHTRRGLPGELLGFLRQQRCGYNPWLDVECHVHDGRTAFGPRPAGTFLDARGGWHDAGDLLKYLLTSGNATAQMLLAWELHRPSTQTPASEGRAALFPDTVDERGRPGRNGIPDLLDEARWGLEWMLKLHPTKDELYHQVADDRDHYGLRLPHREQADYGWGPGQHRVVYGADGQPQGLGKFKSDSTGLANLAGRYAAAMALAWQIWNDHPAHAEFAQRCLQAGREVYALGKKMEGVQQGNSYGAPYRYAESTWTDDMEWAAVELFRATGEAEYLADAAHYARLAGAISWMGLEQTGHYEFYPFFNVGHYRLHGVADPTLRADLERFYREGLDRCAAAANNNPYGIGVPFIWCSNNLLVALVTQGRLYEIMSGDHQYRPLIARHRDWLFGRNPWGVTLFTGVGWRCPTDVHLMTTRLTGRAIAGGLVDGPVYERIFSSLKGVTLSRPDAFAGFQDPRAVYHDDWSDYATNEPTLDGTASALLMLSVLDAEPLR